MTPVGITARIRGLSQGFSYKIVNGAVRLTGSSYGIKWMKWETAEDDRVCVICTKAAGGGRDGYYQLSWFLPQMPAHFGCRCRWVMIIPPQS